jgi:nickel-dependent lactate racemase
VAKANIKIGVGGIGLNPISGYSGGGKIILPGVADYYSSCLNHKMSLAENPRYGEVNHPTRKEMDEVVEMIGLDMIVNVLLNSDGVITDIFVGHPVEAYKNGVKTYQKQNEPLKEVKKADLTLMVQTSPTKPEIVPAYPPNFFSAMDAIIKAGMLTNEDGFIILDYECLSGFFHKNCPSCKVCQAYILNAAKSKSSTDVLQMVSREKIHGWIGPLIYWMSKVKEKIRRFVWVNSLIDKDLKKMNYDVEKDVSKALTKILRDNKKITVNIAWAIKSKEGLSQ